MTDREGYYISESSVYRILKAHDLITSPAFIVLKAADEFAHPTRRVHDLWQTDFTYLKVIHWGWYYLSTVMDDYLRFIIASRLCRGVTAEEMQNVIEQAISFTGRDNVSVKAGLRLLSDNGSCFLSGAFGEYLTQPHRFPLDV